MTEVSTTAPLCQSFDAQIKEITAGKLPLPNVTAIDGDIGGSMLHYREMHCGTAVQADGCKHWNARFYLD
jgi:hypothetical protein